MRAIIWLSYTLLVAATPCTLDHSISYSSSTAPVPVVTMSSSAADMTILITNQYGSPLSLSFGLDARSSSPYGNPQPTALPHSSSTRYIYPDGWAGNVAIGPNLNPNGSKIEGSFINSSVDIDVSYVDGYSVPITCSCEGKAFTGCNLDLFAGSCEDLTDGPVCLNPARYKAIDGPPTPFFAPCAGAAYTFPHDDGANRASLSSTCVSCCIGTSCMAPSRQLPNSTIWAGNTL